MSRLFALALLAFSVQPMALGAEKFIMSGLQTPNEGPVDELIDALYAHSPGRKALVQLSKASKLLHELKFDAARRAASLVKSDPEFGDDARWIMSEAILLQADQDVLAKHFDKAELEAKEVISTLSSIPLDYPTSPINKAITRTLGRANLIMGRAACEAKRWAPGRKDYEAGFARLTGADAEVYIRPEDISSYVQACGHRGTELCTAWLQRMALIFPRSTPESKAIAALLPAFMDELPHASGVGRITSPYHLPDADTTAFDNAMEKYLGSKPKDAIPLFRELLDEYPRSSLRFRAKYWLAQAMLKDKQDGDARKLLFELQASSPLSYYGLLAALATEKDIEVPLVHDVPSAQDNDPFLLPLDLQRLRRAQALFSRKIYDLAALELSEIRPHDALSTPFLVYLAALQSESGSHAAAFHTINEIIQRGSPAIYTDLGLALVFPTEDFSTIKKIAAEFQLDPILVLSLIKQESAFDPRAVSSTGALGLMQIMPATAVDTVADLARTELITPQVNIRTGAKYLSQLLKRFNGNIVYALAAYNAGPGQVNHWIKNSPPDRGITEFIEQIPFKETREYVSSIIRNYFWYARILAPETSRLVKLSHFWGAADPALAAAVLAMPSSAPQPSPSVVFNSASPKPAPSRSPSPSSSPSPMPQPSANISPAPEYGPVPEYGPARTE